VQAPQCRHAIGLEPTKRIGDREPESLVEHLSDLEIDRAAVGGRWIVTGMRPQVTRSADDVDAVAIHRGDKMRDGGRLVLIVAIHCDQPIKAVPSGVFECIDQALAVALIGGVANDADIVELVDALRRLIGGAVIHEQKLVGKRPRSTNDVGDIAFFVVDRNSY